MGNIITPVLPHDLPENWNDTQYVSPGGTEVGLTEKHGYNYLMKQVNNSQKAINELDAELEDINTTLANKAPAGYGLGTSAAALPSTNLDSITYNGWYVIGSTSGLTNPPPFGWGVLHVYSRNSNNLVQEVLGADKKVRRYCADGSWQPWEWVNPPFIKDVVYRTTERHLDNPVYKKMDSNGVIWWSTDQSTWKREADRVGAMPKLGNGRLLDGIPNLNDPNNRISGDGWYRILRSVGNESYLIHIGHGYNSGGPEDMLFKVCTDRYCPSIVVLSNSIYRNDNFYTKIRITYDNMYSYVDFYYASNGENSVQSTIWAFDKNRVGVRAEPLILSKVDDAPSGETILLTQGVSIISSGNVLTVGADNILPPSKGGTGVRSLDLLRRQVGSGLLVDCKAGSSVNITLPDNGTYLICSNDNARQGVILVQTGSSFGKIVRIISLSTPTGWSYAQGNNVLTLSETNGNFDGGFWVTSFGMYVYSGG